MPRFEGNGGRDMIGFARRPGETRLAGNTRGSRTRLSGDPHTGEARLGERLRRAFATPAAIVLGLTLGLLPAFPALAEWDVDGIEELLPRAETPAELLIREEILRQGPRAGLRADPAPAPPVRNCAEWEPAVGVLIRYPLGLPYTLLRDFDDVGTIYVVVTAGNQTAAQNSFIANGVDISKVQWLVKPNDSIWTRDYGPWFVFDGNGDIAIVDHVYNRPARPNDDLTPVAFGNTFGYPVIRHDMWHTGGNYMTDGADFSMSTDLVYDEALSANGMSPAQVNQLMSDYYGIAPYNVVQDISLSGIHHIDTWGKFLDEETVLIKQVWTSHSTYAALEQRATLIGSLSASTGRNYEVHRVNCHDIGGGNPASYTNSLLLNDRIYVPLFSSATNDSAALNVYRAAAPGYDVRGYTYGGFITDDALHCRTMGIMDPGMLRIAHTPIQDAQDGAVIVSAFVDDRSETGVTSVELRYRFDGEGWVTVPMIATGGDNYEGTIPAPSVAATNVDYSIHAADVSGRTEAMPRVAPAAWYRFAITNSVVSAPAVTAAAKAAIAPNPFREGTTFTFALKFPERVALSVFDVRGRLVRALVDETLAGGDHAVSWDGRDDAGLRVPAGIYYFRLRAAGLSHSRPATLVH